jgi:hypothetical protein
MKGEKTVKSSVFTFCLSLAAVVTLLAQCGKAPASVSLSPLPVSGAPSNASSGPEKPLAPLKSPAGDIPDTQVFVTYRSSIGKYSVDAPEGWARTETGGNVKFSAQFDGEAVSVRASAAAPTINSARREQVPAIQKQGRAVTIEGVNAVTLANGSGAVRIEYSSNSDPDPVTGKQLRLSNVTWLFYRQGKVAALTVWAPSGTDNVDQWKRISESFRWR